MLWSVKTTCSTTHHNTPAATLPSMQQKNLELVHIHPDLPCSQLCAAQKSHPRAAAAAAAAAAQQLRVSLPRAHIAAGDVLVQPHPQLASVLVQCAGRYAATLPHPLMRRCTHLAPPWRHRELEMLDQDLCVANGSQQQQQ
eukprot:1139702-Pelagomonas_calceolata.AAC.2